MTKKLLAHSANKEGEEQTLEEHSNNVAVMASTFAKDFNAENWAYNAGLLHDLGKASDDFQKYLKDSNNKDSDEDGKYIKKTNHSSAGAIYAVEKYKNIGKILAYIIAGHHAGLADWYSVNTKHAALSQRIENDKKYFEAIKEYIYSIDHCLKELTPIKIQDCEKGLHLWIQMIFSCIVDSDFLDTEKHLSGDKQRNNFSTIQKLANKFFTYYKNTFINKSKKTQLDKIRNNIFQYCIESAIKKEGFFELTVPTGGGKTLSAMAFAFKHALKFGKKRIIYVIPYTSIIEQTSNKLKEILGDENVVEHHSNVDADKETEQSRLACENWEAPIIITTNVQFFESLYANKSSRCRKIHNIVNSVVILDEAQMLPPEFLKPCIEAMKQLVNNYKATILFSTATQPSLPDIDNIEKIVPDSMDLYKQLKRVNYFFPEKDAQNETWESISKKIQEHKRVLCVVNTRRDCYDLHKLMPKGTIHLSALMCPQHRTEKIAEIKQKLSAKEEIRVISTQLIEAGVDVDFPIVFRAFAGLPSIIQTAGRCNREGKAADKGSVFIFNAPKEIPVGLMRKSADTTKNMMCDENFDIDIADTSRNFFNQLYNKVNSLDKKEIVKTLSQEASEYKFPFATVSKDFHIIEDEYSMPVIVNYNGSDLLIEQVKKFGPNRHNMRRLQIYTVNIAKYIFEHNKDKFTEIHNGIFYAEFLKYSHDVGLNIFDPALIEFPLI